MKYEPNRLLISCADVIQKTAAVIASTDDTDETLPDKRALLDAIYTHLLVLNDAKGALQIEIMRLYYKRGKSDNAETNR